MQASPATSHRTYRYDLVVGALAALLTVAPATVVPVWGGEAASSSTATAAGATNPYLYVGKSREDLRAAFPALSQRELDRLLFRIADIQSLVSLANSKGMYCVGC